MWSGAARRSFRWAAWPGQALAKVIDNTSARFIANLV